MDLPSTTIEIENHAGAAGLAAIRTVTGACDMARLAAWSGVENGVRGGNCFFATTDAACQLVVAGIEAGAWLVTGRFDQPDTPEPIQHAWLELGPVSRSGRTVVNVSRLAERPLYAVPQPDYMRLNHCRMRWQEIPLRRLGIKMRNAAARGGAGGIDVRDFTKSLLAPTFSRF